jgi:hypothetical protein
MRRAGLLPDEWCSSDVRPAHRCALAQLTEAVIAEFRYGWLRDLTDEEMTTIPMDRMALCELLET